jgi:hypothetical protein
MPTATMSYAQATQQRRNMRAQKQLGNRLKKESRLEAQARVRAGVDAIHQPAGRGVDKMPHSV